ncbi:MAG TPA: hypothetical protein VN441_04950 [Syntrophomonas sp.]|jgi:hypothetical protein|nr:hypothetical protein [Syntrophomonas sp.]
MFGNENAGSIRSFIMNAERQCAWDEFMQEYIHSSNVCSDREILDYIQSIHHFTLMDHCLYQPYEPENLFKALHYMCCIAHDLASNICPDDDEQLRENLTKNLFLCIKALNQNEV